MKYNYFKFTEIYKDYKKFEEEQRLVWCRYYLDDYVFTKRVSFVLSLIENYVKEEFVLEVKFWEDNIVVKDFFNRMQNSYTLFQEYSNGEEPGIIVVENKNLDLQFFEQLLQRHYNNELAYEPAFSITPLLFIDRRDSLIVFDFYDDRGLVINTK